MESIEFNGEGDYYCWGFGAWAASLIYDLHIDWVALSQINRSPFGCSSIASLSDKTWFVNGRKCLFQSSQDSYWESKTIGQQSSKPQEVGRTFALQIPWETSCLGCASRYNFWWISRRTEANLHQPTQQLAPISCRWVGIPDIRMQWQCQQAVRWGSLCIPMWYTLLRKSHDPFTTRHSHVNSFSCSHNRCLTPPPNHTPTFTHTHTHTQRQIFIALTTSQYVLGRK